MATEVATMKVAKPGFEDSAESKTFPIRMTLSSTKVKAVEQACRDVISQAGKKSVTVKGPARMPTKVLRITTRKTPCGEGSKTWDRYEMRIHKRVIDFTCSMGAMREIVPLYI
jgi:small subunit ribosomal protein S20e